MPDKSPAIKPKINKSEPMIPSIMLSYRIKLQKELRLNSFLLEFQYVQQLARMIVKE